MDVRGKSTNDKRLIDANRAMEIVRNQGIAHPNAYHLTNYAMLILREAPTVDAVEVVRCRDCIHYFSGACLKIYSDGDVSQYAWQERNEDDFCSYGEQKGR